MKNKPLLEVNKTLIFMRKKSHILNFILFFLSIAVSLFFIYKSIYYRWLAYETIPNPITDEFNYVWQAMSLRQTGIPVAWSTFTKEYNTPANHPRGGEIKNTFAIYTDNKPVTLETFNFNSDPLVAVKEIDYVKGIEHMFFTAPFFDHPPVGGLIYSLGISSNTKTFEQVKAVEFRKPALVLAILTAVLIFIFSFVVTCNSWISMFAVIIYSTVPTYLLATRTSFLENTAVPTVLIHLILLTLATKNLRPGKSTSLLFFVSGIFGGIACITKESVIGFLIGSFFVALLQKVPKKYICFLVLGMSLPVIGYFSWGLWLQKSVFLTIFFANSSRGDFGSLKFISMLTSLRFANFPIDGWWFWGFLSMLLVTLRKKYPHLLFMTVPVFVHFLLVLFLGSPNYPWYYLVLIPFFTIFSAITIWKIITKPTIALVLAFFFIPFSSSFYWGYTVLHLPVNINIWRILFMITLSFTFLRVKFKKSLLIKILWIIFMVVLLYKTFVWNQRSLQYFVANWGNYSTLSLPNFI